VSNSQVILGSARGMPFIESGSVACVVTSPPYNVNAQYGGGYVDSIDWNAYQDLVEDSCAEIARILMPGGRAWINIQATVPYSPPTGEGKNRQSNERRMNL